MCVICLTPLPSASPLSTDVREERTSCLRICGMGMKEYEQYRTAAPSVPWKGKPELIQKQPYTEIHVGLLWISDSGAEKGRSMNNTKQPAPSVPWRGNQSQYKNRHITEIFGRLLWISDGLAVKGRSIPPEVGVVTIDVRKMENANTIAYGSRYSLGQVIQINGI